MSFVRLSASGPLRTRDQIMAVIWDIAQEFDLSPRAALIAGITVAQEVGDKSSDPANNTRWWCPFNAKDPQTEQFDHDSESNDGWSSGYWQQQSPPGRGSWWPQTGGEFGNLDGARRRMDLAEAARSFFRELTGTRVRYRGDSDPRADGDLAQLVQRSAYPDRYQRHAPYVAEVLARVIEPSTPGGNPVAWTGDPVWLETVLREALGDRLRTLPGWQDRGHGDFKDIRGVMWHHTGNSAEKPESIAKGRPDLAGPLANIHIAPNGIVTIVAVGVCWHAGEGSYPWLPTNNANWHMIGVECAWPDIAADGSYDPGQRWPDAQIISMRDTAAALSLKLGVPADHNIGHKDYAGAAQGKWDPGNLDMKWFQGEVDKDMRGLFDDHTEPPVVLPPANPPILKPPPLPFTDRELWEEILRQQRGPALRGWEQLDGMTVVDYLAQLGRKVDAVELALAAKR